MTREPCAACGRETAAGSAAFATRVRAVHRASGEQAVLCAACVGDRPERPEPFTNSRLGAFELSDIFDSPHI